METKRHYSIHGEPVTISGSDPMIDQLIQKFLHNFECSSESLSSPLTISFYSVPSRSAIPLDIPDVTYRIESHTQKVFGEDMHGFWHCEVYAYQGKLMVDLHENGVIFIDYLEGTAQGYLIQPSRLHPDMCVSYFHFTLSELLKRQGLYTIHATAIEKGSRGVLIPGYSGQGKTTACVSLIRSGYRCLSDDHPLFRINDGSLEVLSFPEKVDITENAVKFFPELRNANKGQLHQGIVKRYFYIQDFYPDGIGISCVPCILLFPQVVDNSTSKIERMSKRQALQEILPHGLLVYEKSIAQKEFAALSQLVQHVQCYRLFFGRDVLDLHRIIDPLLQG